MPGYTTHTQDLVVRLRRIEGQVRGLQKMVVEDRSHLQCAGFLLIMIGFLLQWPTISTLVMFPVLVFVYWRLAVGEQREVRPRFSSEWDSYAAQTPRCIPRIAQERQLRTQ